MVFSLVPFEPTRGYPPKHKPTRMCQAWRWPRAAVTALWPRNRFCSAANATPHFRQGTSAGPSKKPRSDKWECLFKRYPFWSCFKGKLWLLCLPYFNTKPIPSWQSTTSGETANRRIKPLVLLACHVCRGPSATRTVNISPPPSFQKAPAPQPGILRAVCLCGQRAARAQRGVESKALLWKAWKGHKKTRQMMSK